MQYALAYDRIGQDTDTVDLEEHGAVTEPGEGLMALHVDRLPVQHAHTPFLRARVSHAVARRASELNRPRRLAIQHDARTNGKIPADAHELARLERAPVRGVVERLARDKDRTAMTQLRNAHPHRSADMVELAPSFLCRRGALAQEERLGVGIPKRPELVRSYEDEV